MSRRPSALLGAALLAALLAGCYFGKPAETHYYVLEYLPTPSKERLQKGPYPYVVRMRDCSIGEAYRRSQIVYRQSAQQMQFYNYHLWAVDPDRMICDMVQKHLSAAKLFANVTRSIESYVPDFYLSTDIQALEEFDSKEQWFAHLAVAFSLEDAKSNQVVWSQAYDVRKTVPQQEPLFVVRALSDLLEVVNDQMVKALDVVLDDYKVRHQEQRDSLRARNGNPDAQDDARRAPPR